MSDFPAVSPEQPMPPISPNWRKIPIGTIQTIFSQAEKYLEAQLQSGIAADQRATTVATILIGVVTAVFGATFLHWGEEHDVRVLASGFSTSVVMLFGAALCLWSSRPVDFCYPGNHPNQWWSVADEKYEVLLGGEIQNYQEKIDDNAKILESNAKFMNWGMRLSIIAPVMGVLVWLLFSDLSYLTALFRVFCPVPV